MFLKKSVLKRLMKQAYKSYGLTVGHSDDGERKGYYVGGLTWIAWFDETHMPKEIKAAIIELCGELPEHEQFKATAEGNQQEIPQTDYNLPAAIFECEIKYYPTRFLRETSGCTLRVMQPETATDISCINEELYDMIDTSLISRQAGEPELKGPFARCVKANRLYWSNDWCYLMICANKTNPDTPEGIKEQEMWDVLSKYRLF